MPINYSPDALPLPRRVFRSDGSSGARGEVSKFTQANLMEVVHHYMVTPPNPFDFADQRQYSIAKDLFYAGKTAFAALGTVLQLRFPANDSVTLSRADRFNQLLAPMAVNKTFLTKLASEGLPTEARFQARLTAGKVAFKATHPDTLALFAETYARPTFNPASRLSLDYYLWIINHALELGAEHATEMLLWLKAAIMINPNIFPAYGDAAIICQVKRDFAQAIQLYTRMLEISPNLARVYEARGKCYQESSLMDLALADYSKVLEFEPLNTPVRTTIIVLLGSLGKYEEANKEADAALELFKGKEQGQFYRTVSYVKFCQGRIDDAVGYSMMAISADPSDWQAHFLLASILTKKNLDAALQEINETIKLVPENKDAHSLKAMILFALGRVPDAASWYVHYVLGPGGSTLQAIEYLRSRAMPQDGQADG